MRLLFDLEMLDAILRGTISPEMVLALSCERVTGKDDVLKEMGHIELATPVCLPACRKRLALLLDMTDALLDSLLLCRSCLVTDPGPTQFRPGEIVPVQPNLETLGAHSPQMGLLSGAEAVLQLLEQVDLERLSGELSDALPLTDPNREPRRYSRILERLMAVEYYRLSRFDPCWSFLLYLPVVPSFLRPEPPEPPEPPEEEDDGETDGWMRSLSLMVSSREAYNAFKQRLIRREKFDERVIPDLDTHYGHVLDRNRRLARLQEMEGLPLVILLNEKKELQRAVDCLIDNANQSEPVQDACGRDLESLRDMLLHLTDDPWTPGT